MPDICGDNRFEVIAEYKKNLIEGTNIESSPEEMAVIDSILFRFWQMGWIPAADVESKRKTGRWKIAGAFDDFYQCPECGYMWPIFSTIEWKCCPICECKIITNRPKGEDNGTV